MKKFIVLISILILSLSLSAQNCNPYFDIKQGTTIERASYDAKGKLLNKSTEKVIENKKTNSGFNIHIQTEAFDEKGKSVATIDMHSTCINGTYSTDLTELINKMLPADAKDKIKIEADKMTYPKSMKPGDKLPKSTMKISAGKLINITYETTNRIVQSREVVNTPAGKFECLKITYDVNLKFMGNKSFKSIEYLAPGVGVVKQEQYTKGNKLESTSVVQKIRQ